MRRVHSIAGAAEIAGLGTTKIKGAIRAGELEARKAGRRTLITDNALAAYIEGLPKVADISSPKTGAK
jgi:hypothetical protein